MRNKWGPIIHAMAGLLALRLVFTASCGSARLCEVLSDENRDEKQGIMLKGGRVGIMFAVARLNVSITSPNGTSQRVTPEVDVSSETWE